MKNQAETVLDFHKESISELNTDGMRAVDSGVNTTTLGTTSTVIQEITDIIARTTVTF